MDLSRFKSNFSVAAGTVADVKSYGGMQRPTTHVLCLATVVGMEPLTDGKGKVFAGAHKVFLQYPAEYGGFEDNIIVNEPTSGDTPENIKKSKRGYKTSLESMGYTPEQAEMASGVGWFMPDQNGTPRQMAVVWRPGAPGVANSYGDTMVVTRERYNQALASKVDPATLVPARAVANTGVPVGVPPMAAGIPGGAALPPPMPPTVGAAVGNATVPFAAPPGPPNGAGGPPTGISAFAAPPAPGAPPPVH